MQGNATTKANPVSFYWIESPADLIPCMGAAGGLGYSGVATSTVAQDGQVFWSMSLNSPTQAGVEATIGNVVVWDGRQLTVYPDSDSFLALYVLAP